MMNVPFLKNDGNAVSFYITKVRKNKIDQEMN